MKLKAPDAAAAAERSPINWFLGICVAAFLTTISASAAAPRTGAGELNPAEKWVVARVTAGEKADLSKQFPADKDRKLSAHFLEDLLIGTLSGVKLRRHGVRIIGAIIDEPIDLENAQIPYEVWLISCQFSSRASFANASFAQTVAFAGSTFKTNAYFDQIKVGANAYFSKTVFEGGVSFVAANIVGYFAADHAQFTNKEKTVGFHAMEVGSDANFSNTVFEGPVSFVAANIVGYFDADHAQFTNKEKTADFQGTKVGFDARFSNSVFEGPVSFVAANVVGYFAAGHAQFRNKEKTADFQGMKVGFDAYFTNTVFEGPVIFILANISTFYADEAQFKNKEKTANFEGMKVGGVAFFRKTVFEGPANFVGADIGKELHMEEAQFRNPRAYINFNVMKVGGGAMFPKAVFQGPVDFQQADIGGELRAHEAQFKNKELGVRFADMKVGGHASFYKTVFEGPVDFSYAEFTWLDLSSPFWPKAAPKFQMQGMNYKYVRAAPNEPESHEALLKLANRSAYSGDVYSNLEAFFSRQGYHADADRAFIAGKCRARKEHLRGLRCLVDWFHFLFVGYGRHPWQAIYFIVAFVLLGCFLFPRRKMEAQKPEYAARVYNRFWYSLGLFLPFVDLQVAKEWKPRNDRHFITFYMRLHILFGWILIPFFLAALAGLVK